jgi:hypothetical protein
VDTYAAGNQKRHPGDSERYVDPPCRKIVVNAGKIPRYHGDKRTESNQPNGSLPLSQKAHNAGMNKCQAADKQGAIGYNRKRPDCSGIPEEIENKADCQRCIAQNPPAKPLVVHVRAVQHRKRHDLEDIGQAQHNCQRANVEFHQLLFHQKCADKMRQYSPSPTALSNADFSDSDLFIFRYAFDETIIKPKTIKRQSGTCFSNYLKNEYCQYLSELVSSEAMVRTL